MKEHYKQNVLCIAYYQQRVSKKCNTQSNCSKYRLNLSVKVSQNNCFQTLYEKSNKKLLATFVELFAHSALSAERQREREKDRERVREQKNNKSYQWNFLKVVVLKCSTVRSNEQLLSWKALHIAYYQQKVSKNVMLKRVFQSTDIIYQ